MHSSVVDKGVGSSSLPGAEPTTAGEKQPGIVVVHDWYGPDDWNTEAAARLQSWGYATLSPNLFAGSTFPEPATDAALDDWAHSLTDSRVVNDLLRAADELSLRDGVDASRVGIAGWGWGGAYALMAASHDNRLRAVVAVGATVSYPVLTPRRPGSPLNFVANLNGPFFGAYPGSDPALPMNEIDRLRARLVEHDKSYEFKVYAGAPARFWRDVSNSAGAALWKRIELFLAAQLLPRDAARQNYSDIVAHEEGYADAANSEKGRHNEEFRLHA